MNNGAVPCEFERYLFRRLASDRYQLLFDLHSKPPTRRAIPIGIIRVSFFDVQVLLVDSKDSDSPGDPFVVTCCYAWQSGFPCT